MEEEEEEVFQEIVFADLLNFERKLEERKKRIEEEKERETERKIEE